MNVASGVRVVDLLIWDVDFVTLEWNFITREGGFLPAGSPLTPAGSARRLPQANHKKPGGRRPYDF